MSRQSWQKDGFGLTNSNKLFRDAILNQQPVQIALARYVNSLNLQGQINSGKITEDQALAIFDQAGKNFMANLNAKINSALTTLNNPAQSENDLSNPINMQNALNNPNTQVSLQMNEVASMIISEIDNQIQTQQAENIEEKYEAKAASADAKASANADITAQPSIANEVEKGAAIIGALKALHDLDPKSEATVKETIKISEDVFHKVTGIKGGSFENIAKNLEGSLAGKSHTAVLRPHNFIDNTKK
ncbi:MAG TPA: hypothetical protein VJK30_06685 [Coxiellaceae bacterium]|nr:MAG: hypothetical protein A3E81_05530 [Gammaproteobacteria bacterium RIFCSPHIGHO2_12_FULL_36_30]HLB56995.1 hypothetical protein [Coxiellaceae bacterium]